MSINIISIITILIQFLVGKNLYSFERGSYPDPPNGWHLHILFTARKPPLIQPLTLIASTAYSEHVGKKRHLGTIIGEIK